MNHINQQRAVMEKTSVIVSTFNRKEHLQRCMAALEMQTLRPHEVIIADDGSAPEYIQVAEKIAETSSLNVRYIWREDRGFCVAASRNNAARHASGDTLFFMDADIVLFPDALEQHLAASRGRYWTGGYCLRLTNEESNLLTEACIRKNRLNTFWPCDDERLAHLEKMAGRFNQKSRRALFWPSEYHLRKVKLRGAQFSVPRDAFEKIQGFDDRFVGWGLEDDDLGLRLLISGVRGRTVVQTSRAYHLWHPIESRSSKNKRLYTRHRQGEYCWRPS